MEKIPLCIHYHNYAVKKETFLKSSGLVENLKITQEGEWIDEDTGEYYTFINSMEGKKYPWYSTMYHPEY